MKDFDWKLLTTLYLYKNISKTAELLFTSQPNLTKRLKLIEEELGVQIVIRSSKGVNFTHQGEYIAMRAAEIINLIDETKNQITDISNSNGTIKIAAPNSFTRNELPSIINQFKQRYKQVNFQLSTCLSNEIPVLLRRGDVEVGFVHGNLNFNNESFLLFHEILFIVSKNQIDIVDLPSKSQIDYVRSPMTSKIINNWWYSHFEYPPNIILRVSHGDICRELVCSGLGYGFFFGNNFIDKNSELNRIIAMKDKNTPISRETWVIYNKPSFQRVVVRNFINFIREWKDFHETTSVLNVKN